jgi:hypothetical protein
MTGRVATLVVLFAGAAFSPAAAQTGDDLLSRGIAAYRALEYDVAAALLRRALSATGRGTLSISARAETYAYLAATEFYRNRPDSAGTAFRRALAADPRYRPDRLVFPPEVTAVFDAERRNTLYVRVDAPADTTITPDAESYVLRLHASSPHEISVDLAFEDGRSARRLYSGPVRDSLEVGWEGLAAEGEDPLEGRLAVLVTSRSGPSRRTVRLPLLVRVLREDTLDHPLPPFDTLQLRRTSARRALGALGAGVLSGVTAVTLPTLVASDRRGTAGRYVVGGTLTLAGVIAFISRRPRASSPGQERHVAEVEAWEREVAAVVAENERRRGSARVRVTSRAAIVVEGDDQ